MIMPHADSPEQQPSHPAPGSRNLRPLPLRQEGPERTVPWGMRPVLSGPYVISVTLPGREAFLPPGEFASTFR
jgi:hypothetical protein